MPRKSRQAAAQAEAPEQEQQAAAPTDGTDFNPAELEQQSAAGAQQPVTPAEGDAQEKGEGKFADNFPPPRGRQGIDIGNGRRMRLFRGERFKQMAIKFYAPEGENPKPEAETISLLHQYG
jgi:hypothetical protein